MMMRDRLVQQGDLLFRHRGWAPLVLVPAGVLALRDSEWIELRFGDLADDLWDWMCFSISSVGLALRVATAAYAARRTSGRNKRKGQEAAALNVTGPYSVVRHPLYLANVFILIGVLLATGSPWLTAVGLLACCLHYERVICAEEAFLLDRFGTRYSAWAERTPAFVPRLSQWLRPSRPFCWRTALRREYQTVFELILVFVVLDYVEDLVALGRLELEFETTALFLLALAGFSVVRFLHKRTRLLHAPDAMRVRSDG